LTLANVVRQIKSSFLLFFYLYFIIFASTAAEIKTEIKTEIEIYNLYQNIRSDDSMPRQEKDILLNQLLKQAVSFKNPLYNALIISRLYYSAQSKGEQDKILEWQAKYDQAVNQISSEQTLLALSILSTKAQIHALQNQQKHIAALKIVLDSFHRMKNITPEKKESIINGEIYITHLDIAEFNNLAGISYFSIGDYEHAQQYFFTSLNLYEELAALKGVAATLNNLSLISWAQKDFNAALKYLERPLKISIKFSDSAYYIKYISNTGIYYTELKQFDNAISSYKKAINHPESKLFPKETLGAIIGLAETYIMINELTLAEKWLKKALQLSTMTSNERATISAKGFIGDIYLLQGKYSDALTIFNRSLLYYQEKKLQRFEAETYKRISKTYQAQQQWEQALNYYDQYTLLINKLNSDAQQNSVNVLHAQYKAEVKQKQITLLQAENQLNTLELESTKTQGIIFLVVSTSVLIIILLVVSRYYSRKEQIKLRLHNKEISASAKQLMLLSIAFKNTSDAVWITNKNFEIEAVNNAYVTHTHKNKSAVIGQKVTFAQINGQPADFSEKLRLQAMNNDTWLGELYDQKSTGEIYCLELEIEAIKNDNNEIIHYLGVFRDITERIKVQEQLSKLATHDDLTELPNRTLLHELIAQSSLNSQRSQKSPTVLLLDVNNFKKINDTHGHSAGDKVICEIAKRLSAILYPKDVIARINGAEFCVLVELSDPKYGATAVARKVLSCFDDLYNVERQQISVTASIGITRFPEDAENPQELLRKAGLAMFDIKAQRKNNYKFFEPQMNNVAAEQLAHEQKLLTAIKNDSFDFYYQPFVDTKSGIISGAEALIRWVEPDGSIIYPDSFIPFSEKLGFIDQIDKIAINKVFMQVAEWQKQSINFGPISINVSAKMFTDSEKLISLLQDKLTEYQITPSRIKIEITEGMLLENIDLAIKTMDKIKALGFKLSLDDFGTGFSSLNYLKKFPIDVLKIDRSFIMDMHKSDVDKNIVRSIVNLANNLNLSVIAEGVEINEHLEFLKQLNCQQYQGYLFSKAIPINEIEQLVITQNILK
jgi:diguanylate cyclase (GGDEF)-like protein/PAS domain S-box-containing protein